MPDPVNDESRLPVVPEPYGEAALVLVESLIHGLLARSTLSVAETIDVVDVAIEVLDELGDSRGDPPVTGPTSSHLLRVIAHSLRMDADPEAPAIADPGE